MSAFSKKAKKATQEFPEDTGRIKTTYTRDLSDNKLFSNIQVDDISKITDKNTKFYLDGDGVVWKACSSVESMYIEVKHKTECIFFEIDNITKFKGRGSNISENSWLGLENIKRESKGLVGLVVEDFDIVQKSRLNYTTEEKAFEQVQVMIRTKLKNLRDQFQIDNIIFCIGEGECFRNHLDLVEPYKGQRSPLRPIMLKKVRQWVVDVLGGEVAPQGFENDDYVEWKASKGYQDFKKTGIVSAGCIGEDKDMYSNPKLLISFGVHTGEGNPNKGKFKYPKPWLIPDSSVSVGEIDLIIKGVKTPKKECKSTGLMWLVMQSFLLGDTADNYKPLQHLKDYKTKYGDVQAYKDFSGLTTPKEVLQKVVDLYFELFTMGVKYTSHKGIEMDVDTMTYMDTYFRVAYMTRSETDTMDFYKLCKAFKVDTSKIIGNNKPTTKPIAPEQEIRDTYEDVVSELNAISEVLKLTKGKKSDLVENMEKADKMLEMLWCTLVNGLFVEETI